MARVMFTDFELGQLYSFFTPTQFSKLSPQLRQKLKGEFNRVESEGEEEPLTMIELATDNEPEEINAAISE